MVRFLALLVVTFGFSLFVLLPSAERDEAMDLKIRGLQIQVHELRDLLFQSATLGRVNARAIDNCTLQHTVDNGLKAVQDHLYPDDLIIISGPDNLNTVRR